MREITEPGTITDLIEDTADRGHQVTARLIRDWTEAGLLDYPQKRSAGKGHGSLPALYAVNQRKLLLTLLDKRATDTKKIPSLARIPVGIWMYWGEDYVPLRQARRAFMTWLGDPRASKQQAHDSARAMVTQLDNPRATPQARRELREVLAEIAQTGDIDDDRLEWAVRAVFEPDAVRVHRAVGHPSAPMTADSTIGLIRARVTAATHLLDGVVTDEALLDARQAHLMHYFDYAREQPQLAAGVPPELRDMYEPVTAEVALNRCCHDLLTTIGLQILHPEAARQMLSK